MSSTTTSGTPSPDSSTPEDSMSGTRRLIVVAAAIALSATAIYQAWYPEKPKAKAKAPTAQASTALSYEDRVFALQAKMIVGLLYFMDKQAPAATKEQQQQLSELGKEVKASFAQSMLTSETMSGKRSQKLLALQFTIGNYLSLSSVVQTRCEDMHELGEESPEFVQLVRRGCRPAPAGEEPQTYSEAERDAIATQLGWFGKLFLVASDPPEVQDNALRTQVLEEALRLFIKFLVGAVVFGVIGLVSSILCLVFLVKSLGGKLTFRYRDQGMHSDYALEIFTLYLLGMVLLPKILEFLDLKGSILKANIIGISSLFIFMLWPLLFGQSFRAIRARLGLEWHGFKTFFANIVLGPVSYITAIVPMFIVLMLYSVLLMAFKVDPGQGAHPIVPIITKSQNNTTLYLVIGMAVVLAPLIEEVMFRGALYSWLRARLGAAATILISSLLFAAVHPQGAIGLVPLTSIGLVLAFLREWRGSLIPCMFAHASFNAGTLFLVVTLFK